MIDIKTILERSAVVTHFQPIISLKDREIIGVEALSRGTTEDSDELVPPIEMINAAENENMSLQLDRLFRHKAFQNFKPIAQMSDKLLFVNVDTKILDCDKLQLGWTRQEAESHQLETKRIVIEICESKIENTEKLINFVENYRQYGFIIAIDDFGDSHSNLERIIQVKPDIIKLARTLIDDVHNDFCKEAIVRATIQLAKNIGAVTIAEGVENIEDVLKCHELGIDFYQGFYFAKPSDCCISSKKQCQQTIFDTLDMLTGHMKQYVKQKYHKHQEFLSTYFNILNKLNELDHTHFDSILNKFYTDINNVESIYVLDNEGRQTYKSETAFFAKPFHRHHFFHNGSINSDHSQKDYFVYSEYYSPNVYISDEFMSHTSRNFCKTISSKFINTAGQEYTLCIDFIINKTTIQSMTKTAGCRL